MTADIEIDGLNEGYVVTTHEAFSTNREYTPTIGQAFAKVVYRLLRREADMPAPYNKVEGSNEIYESDTLTSIMTFLKTFGPKAIDKALADNLAEVKAFEEKHPEPKEIITEEGTQTVAQDI